jgi:hypothetical protein
LIPAQILQKDEVMPVGLERLEKKKKEPLFEKYISKGLFDLAGTLAINTGYKAFGELIIHIGDVLPYINANTEEAVKIKIVKAYRKTLVKSTPGKKDALAFSTLENAMEFLQIKLDKLDNTEDESERRRFRREKNLLEPTTEFVPLSKAYRIGVSRADVIIIGKRSRIENALNNYDYTIDGFSQGQIIIRNVTLLGLRTDSFFHFSKKPLIKPKYKKGSWKDKIEKKRTPKFTIMDLTKLVSLNKKLNKWKIVSNKYFRYNEFVYFLLLPPTLIMLPYCQQVKGTIIPLIDTWSILGVEQ